jgi:hypothetical protein
VLYLQGFGRLAVHLFSYEQVTCQDGKTQFFRGVMKRPGFLMDISYSINVSFCFKMFQNVSKCLDALHCQLFQGFTSPPGTKIYTKKKAESLFQAEKSIFPGKSLAFPAGYKNLY